MNKIGMFLCVATVSCAAMAETTNTIVGGPLLNGDFNNPASAANFDQLTNWVNIGTGASTLNATLANASDQYDATPYALIGGTAPGISVFGLDTGYTVAEGDVFDVAYVWKDAFAWSDGSDQVRVSLFVTHNNSIDGIRTDLVADLSGFSTANASYETVNHLGIYLASAADQDKTLFVAIDAAIVDQSYAYLDNFELVVRSDTSPPAAPADLSAADGDGYVFLNWPPNTESDLSSYSIYRSAIAGSYGEPLVTGITESEYTDESVINGMTYYYVVKAADGVGNESAASPEVSGSPANYVIYSTKKGVGSGGKYRVESMNVGWYYSWSMNRNFDIDAAIEFVPMRHNRYWPSLSELANCGSFDYLLSYNEPERPDQANMTVQQAIDQWPQLEAAADTYGVELSSPAPSGATQSWLADFMTQATSLSYRVDFMAFHKYPNPNQLFNSVKNDCNWLWAQYGKPIWVTEFNGADWSQTGSWSMKDTYTTMIELLYYFESTSYVERYAIFPWDVESSAGAPSPVFEVEIDPVAGTTNSTATLTPLGNLYAEYSSADIHGPYLNTWYYLHNKGSKKRLRDNAGVAATAEISVEDGSVEFELIDTGGGNYYIVNRASGDRLASDGSTLSWADAAVTDDTVKWSKTDDANGWDYINHVGSGKRLSGNPLGVVSGGTTGTAVQWSFVRAPSMYESETGPYEIWATDALAGMACSKDLGEYAPAQYGGAGSFSIIAGPAWLNMDTNGVISGTPGTAYAGTNEWQFVVSDGVDASTGTLHMAVRVATIVQYETFDAPTFQNADPQVWTSSNATTTVSNGTWVGNWSVPLNNSRLRLYTPNNGDAVATRSLLLDESLFADGAGTYVLRFELKDLSIQFNTPTLYIDLYDVSLDAGGSIDIDSYAGFGGDFFYGLPGLVATNAPATVSLMTNLSWLANAVGIKTAEFEYDGSGDVLVNIGASKLSTPADDWWQIHIDDFIIHGIPQSLQGSYTWAHGYGLSGTNAAAAFDYDDDGNNNFTEFALGGDPTDGIDTHHSIDWGAGGTDLVYSYPRRKNSTLTYTLEISTNLTSNVWTNSGYTQLPGTEGIDADFETVTNVVPLDALQAFIRLKIEE